MITSLVLTPTVRDDLFAHARADTATEESADQSERPVLEEVCGVLAGKRRDEHQGKSDAETAFITTFRCVPNVAEKPMSRYELDPAATVRAIERLESEGLNHLGFYHSHPRGPRGPSATDQAQATWPGYVFLIVSLGTDLPDADPGAEPAIGAWRWTGDLFVQLPISITDIDA